MSALLAIAFVVAVVALLERTHRRGGIPTDGLTTAERHRLEADLPAPQPAPVPAGVRSLSLSNRGVIA